MAPLAVDGVVAVIKVEVSEWRAACSFAEPK
jgi:hypothetical protein